VPDILTRHELERCLDGAPQFEYELSPPIDEPTMRRLAEGARLQYFPHFPRPYFRIDRPRGVVVQGVMGGERLRVAYSSNGFDEAERELRLLIER
jgi:hypothetical protein